MRKRLGKACTCFHMCGISFSNEREAVWRDHPSLSICPTPYTGVFGMPKSLGGVELLWGRFNMFGFRFVAANEVPAPMLRTLAHFVPAHKDSRLMPGTRVTPVEQSLKVNPGAKYCLKGVQFILLETPQHRASGPRSNGIEGSLGKFRYP